MEYQKELINIIKTNNRDKFYIIVENIIANNSNPKKHILDLCLSFLAIEDNKDNLEKYFTILIGFYQKNNINYDISSYPLIIKISSVLGYFENSISYLFDMEKLNIPIKTRTISHLFEKLPLNNTKYFLEKYNLELDTFKILVDSFDKHYKVFTNEQYYHLLNHFKYNNSFSCGSSNYKSIIFEKLKKIFEIWYDIDFIFDNKTVNVLIDLFPNYNLESVQVIDKMFCSRCHHDFKKHNLTYLEREILISQILEKNKTKSLDKFYQWCLEQKKENKDSEKVYYIIDGGNVGHSSNGDFTPSIIINLLKLLNTNTNTNTNINNKNICCILILHQRHKKNINGLIPNLDNIKVYYTPYNENDDLYWLLLSFMFENSFVITNDQMRDHHVNKLDEKLFNRWKDTHIIKYFLDNTSFKFEYPSEYTIGFQTPGNNILHLPVNKPENKIEWFCMMLNK